MKLSEKLYAFLLNSKVFPKKQVENLKLRENTQSKTFEPFEPKIEPLKRCKQNEKYFREIHNLHKFSKST